MIFQKFDFLFRPYSYLSYTVALILACLFATTAGKASAVSSEVLQERREIPILEEVDVLVVGGSTRAVSAAVAASREGAKVFLITPKPYLGEDLAGSLRLWLPREQTVKTPLSERLYAELEHPSFSVRQSVEATYTTSIPSSAKHPDTNPPSLLTDGKAGDPIDTSVQFNQDVTLDFELKQTTELQGVHLAAHDRSQGEAAVHYQIDRIEVLVPQGEGNWKKVAEATPKNRARTYTIDIPVNLEAEKVRLNISKKPSSGRILLSEVSLIPSEKAERGQDVQSDRPRAMLRPLAIKKACDDALLEATIPFLYGSYPAALVEEIDRSGKIAGLVIANRAGRQAILANVIVDATDDAVVAKMAGGRLERIEGSQRRARRIIIGGTLPEGDVANVPLAEGESLRCRLVGYTDPGGKTGGVYYPSNQRDAIEVPSSAHEVYEYTVSSDSARPASLLEKNRWEQRVLDLTFRTGQLRGGLIHHEPQAALKKRGASPEKDPTFDSVETVPEKLFFQFESETSRFSDLSAIGVLSDRADAGLLPSRVKLDVCQWMALGQKVGREAARRAKKASRAERPAVLSGLEDVASEGGETETVFAGRVEEVLHGPRPISRSLPVVPCQDRKIPAIEPFDVVVIGGGTSGAPAGIGAARSGAKTLVVEYQEGLGGVGTFGLIGRYHYGMRIGFTEEVPPQGSEDKMEWWRSELRQAGAEIFLESIGCGVLMEGHRVTGAVIATEQGRYVVPAKVVIDATGNSDIAIAAGAQIMTVDSEDIAMQGAGFPSRELGAFYTNTDYLLIDDADMIDTWRVLVDSKRKYPESFDVGTFLQTRERRRVVGDYILSYLDQMAERTYPDTIVLSHSNYDSHGYPSHPLFYVVRPLGEKRPDGAEVFTPYRCLLPRGIEGLLVIGLGTSAYRDAMALIRMQADLQNQGYAAGLAAAQAVEAKVLPRGIDVDRLQEKLVAKGNLPEEVLKHGDSFPVSEETLRQAVREFAVEGPNSKNTALIFAHQERALPMVEAAYEQAEGERKVDCAILLGICGRDTGGPLLINELEAIETDRSGTGWDPRKPLGRMAEFSQLPTRMDALILALARSGEEAGIPVILKKASTLSPEVCLSHHRAVALALETYHREDIAKVLEDVLRQPGMIGYAWTELDEKPTRPDGSEMTRIEPLREIMLARALYRNGDDDGLAESILRAYTQDLRGLLARHAVGILKSEEAASRQ